MDSSRTKAFDLPSPLELPSQDRVFSGVYYGAYLTRKGDLYALGATEQEGILGKKDGMSLIARNVVHAAVGAKSIAYVTQDGHLHVHGGVLGVLFAEGPDFTGAKRVYSFNLDAFLAVGWDGRKYIFGENKDNLFELKDYYWFQLDFRPADDPEILKVMRERKKDFGTLKLTQLLADVPAYWAWEREVTGCPEAMLLSGAYRSSLRISPTTKYSRADGSPEGIYAFAGVPNAYIIRPESGFLESVTLAPENVLSTSCPLFTDDGAWKRVDPKAHKKAICIEDEERWFMLDGTTLYILQGSKKTVVANNIADIDVSALRVLILTNTGRLFQSSWRKQKPGNIEGVLSGPLTYPLESFSAFCNRQSQGLLAKAFNKFVDTEWEEIHWKP